MKRETVHLRKGFASKWLVLAAILFAAAVSVFASGRICLAAGNTYRVVVNEGYLALRTAKAFERENEIGELYTGDTVEVQDTSDSTYWYVYSPKHGKYGYVNQNYLVSEPSSAPVTSVSGNTWVVKVASGYLALRTAKAYDSRNEIGKLYTGDTVQVQDASDSAYWYVYSSKLGKYGYVNKDYLILPASSNNDWTVKVASGYLALRTAKAYDSRNEIGKLYTGDTVQIQDSSDSAYWYVYSPKLGKYGYVNKDYLVPPASAGWTVKVDSGYLALRTAKAYDSRNEIGKLYTGDTVQVQDASDATYWYVYSPKLDKYGYVNKNYLYSGSVSTPVVSSSAGSWTVKVDSGYLALRTAKAYDSSNEIGKLYTGDTVQVQNTSDATYWYVYSPKLGKYGYVNKNYLY